jgi:hypothetical protein
MRKLLAPLGLAAVLLSACGGGTSSSQSSPTAQPSIANSIDFPLFANSRVLVAKNYTQVVNTTNAPGGGILLGGNGQYKGNEVIAASPASFDQLRTWLRSVSAKLPPGYTNVQESGTEKARAEVQRYGMDFAVFQKTGTGKDPTGLLVLVMDPAHVSKSLGPALNLITRYRSLPDFAKKPIDDQVKAQTGFSVTEALQPESPIGTALDALAEFSHSDQRAVILVNAQKQ